MFGIPQLTPLESVVTLTVSGSTPIGEQSPGTYRSRPPSLTSACAITTCGQGNRRRRCGAAGSRERLEHPSPGLGYQNPARQLRGARLCPPTAGRGARLEPPGPRVAEASRAPVRRLPGSGALCPPRYQPPPVVSSPAAHAAVAGSGSPASAQVGSAGGRRPGKPARPGGRSAALRSFASPLSPARSGPARSAASGTLDPSAPQGERRPAFRRWASCAPALGPPH